MHLAIVVWLAVCCWEASAGLRVPTTQASAPKLLSEMGAFTDLRTLTPSPDLIPYDINVSFWSDGAEKHRWIRVPEGKSIGFSPSGFWRFPAASVAVKHFEMRLGAEKRRLETRFLVVDGQNSVFGFTYRWRADQSDAELVTESRG